MAEEGSGSTAAYATLEDTPSSLGQGVARRWVASVALCFALAGVVAVAAPARGAIQASPVALKLMAVTGETTPLDNITEEYKEEGLDKQEIQDLDNPSVDKMEEDIEENPVILLPDRCPGSIGPDLLDNREALEGDNGEVYPFLSSFPFEQRNPHVVDAVIWIHGFSGKADEYFCDAENFVREVGMENRTINLAPWFGSVMPHPGNHWLQRLTGEQKLKVWGPRRWMAGEMGTREAAKATLTSFDMMDTMIQLLSRKELYPNLKKISIAGFSAGCQFASRYSFFSLAPLPADDKPEVQVIASNCGSYLYFDKRRPDPVCRPLHDTGADHTCSSFSEKGRAPKWLNYKVGLRNVVLRRPALNDLIELFPKKNVKFLLGTMDTCNCNTADYQNPEICGAIANCLPDIIPNRWCCDTFPDNTVKNVFDATPASMLEGSNRFQRGLNYMSYLHMFYNTTTFPTYGTFIGGHNAKAFSRSKLFASWVFS